MNIQKIKELALANGFKLKEQASGNMDLHSYVYEFAQAVTVETLNQAQLVFGQDGVTTFDTESLDNEISNISNEFENVCLFDNDDVDRLEMLIAKAMRLGELYERQKWQAAKAQAVPESNALLSATLDAIQKLGSGDFVLVPKKLPNDLNDRLWDFMTDNFVATNDDGDSFMCCDDFDLKLLYSEIIKAQEPAND